MAADQDHSNIQIHSNVTIQIDDAVCPRRTEIITTDDLRSYFEEYEVMLSALQYDIRRCANHDCFMDISHCPSGGGHSPPELGGGHSPRG